MNHPMSLPIDVVQEDVNRTFDSYLMNQVLSDIKDFKVPENWDTGDWHCIVMGIILNKTDAMVIQDLRLLWNRRQESHKLIGQTGLKFISKARKALKPHMEKLKELFSQTASKYMTYAHKFSRMEELNFVLEHALYELKDNLAEGDSLATNANMRLAAIVSRYAGQLHKEVGVTQVFEMIHKHEQEISWSEASLEKSAAQLGVTKEQLVDSLLENKYKDQLA